MQNCLSSIVAICISVTILQVQVTDAFIDLDWQLKSPKQAIVNNVTGEVEVVYDGSPVVAPQPQNFATETILITHDANITIGGPAVRNLDDVSDYIKSLVEPSLAGAFGAASLSSPPSCTISLTSSSDTLYALNIVVYVIFDTVIEAAEYKADVEASNGFANALQSMFDIAVLAGMDGRETTISATDLDIQFTESAPDNKLFTPVMQPGSKSKKGKSKKSKKGKYLRVRSTGTATSTANQGTSIIGYGIAIYALVAGVVVAASRNQKKSPTRPILIESASAYEQLA